MSKWNVRKLGVSVTPSLWHRQLALVELQKTTTMPCDWCLGTGVNKWLFGYTDKAIPCDPCNGEGHVCAHCHENADFCECGG